MNHMVAQLRYVSYASVPKVGCVLSCDFLFADVQLEFCNGGLRILT